MLSTLDTTPSYTQPMTYMSSARLVAAAVSRHGLNASGRSTNGSRSPDWSALLEIMLPVSQSGGTHHLRPSLARSPTDSANSIRPCVNRRPKAIKSVHGCRPTTGTPLRE